MVGFNFNPGNVMFNADKGSSGQNYVSSNVLDPSPVRATGSGPFDAAYRQNLATYSGGLFQRPKGGLSFNPTDPNSLMNQFQPGQPMDLLSQALGGGGFSWASPQPQSSSPDNYWQFWLNQQQAPNNFLKYSRQGY